MAQPYTFKIVGGTFTAIPRDGEPRRVFPETTPQIDIEKGIVHFRFVLPPHPPTGWLRPKQITVHCLPDDEPFPDDKDKIRAIQQSYGLTLVSDIDPLHPELPTYVVVDVDTGAITNATGELTDAHWVALVDYEK